LNHGEVRCFLLDNHRPLHLANVYSRYNVVVLDDGSIEAGDLPSDGSDLSSDDDDSNSDEDDGETSEVEKFEPQVPLATSAQLNHG
jgi:cell division control protein 45